MNILIIEDEVILLKVLKEKFEENEWNVETAQDGEIGLEKIKKSPFDVVLLDLLLPKKGGFEVLKEIRADKKYKNLPIIIISNLGGHNEIQEALGLGANGYFVKTQHSLREIVDKVKTYI